MAQLGTDTPELYETALDAAKDYLKSKGEKTPTTFQLESNRAFPWRAVMWGNSSGIAQYVVHLDAGTGKPLGKN